MAGFREFAAGEPLTAANVDGFLMKQSVMKFADAAARDSALGTTVAGGNALREGMIAYLDSTNDVLKYDGSAWTTVNNLGIGSNVVQAVKTDTFAHSSITLTAVPDLEVKITPASTSNKVFIIADMRVSNTEAAGSNIYANLFRDGTTLVTGDAVGDRFLTFSSTSSRGLVGSSQQILTAVFVDSPNSDVEVTYDVRVATNGGTLFVNRGETDSDTASFARSVSTLTVIEVAG